MRSVEGCGLGWRGAPVRRRGRGRRLHVQAVLDGSELLLIDADGPPIPGDPAVDGRAGGEPYGVPVV